MAIIEKIGHKISFKKPKKTTFEVECDDRKLSLAFALDRAKTFYPNLDWNNVDYAISNYKYNELL